MAWDFGAEISALSGFSADYNVDISTGETYRAHANQWLTDGAKEVLNILPKRYKLKCSTRTTLNNSTPTLDLDGKGDIFHVVRLSADSNGFQKECRKIDAAKGDLTNDSNDLMNYATVTDPVYWQTSNSSGNPTLFVKPTPTANQPAYVHYLAYPTVAFDENSITNFPDEAEYIVILYAAIRATEYMMLAEEDPEIYSPQLNTLKADYTAGLNALGGGSAPPAGGGR